MTDWDYDEILQFWECYSRGQDTHLDKLKDTLSGSFTIPEHDF